MPVVSLSSRLAERFESFFKTYETLRSQHRDFESFSQEFRMIIRLLPESSGILCDRERRSGVDPSCRGEYAAFATPLS